MREADDNMDWRDLIDRYLDGTIAEEEFVDLEVALKRDSQVRGIYLEAVKTDTLLREIAGKIPDAITEPATARPRNHWVVFLGSAASIAALIAVAFLASFGDSAKIGSVEDAGWLSLSLEEGHGLNPGDEVQLASGSVEIQFRSGALTRIHGPARIEITSDNGAFLHHGEIWSRADTEASEGFTIQTHSGKFVDRGTEFLMTAKLDGFSQMHVASGAVDAEVDGYGLQRFGKGSGLGVEPGHTPVMIRIEPGDESPQFNFPTLPPPSATDEADLSIGRSKVRLISSGPKGRKNFPHQKSGKPDRLIDGVGQISNDKPEESLYFSDGANGNIMLDLGREIPVSRVHTYSWHLNKDYPDMRRRAVQRYTLWGSPEAKPEAMPSIEQANGWIRIARVDTDAFFRVEEEPDRPAQQACAIHTSAPSIGNYRYLLFQVVPTPMPEGKLARHTFFGEIDVFSTDSSQ